MITKINNLLIVKGIANGEGLMEVMVSRFIIYDETFYTELLLAVLTNLPSNVIFVQFLLVFVKKKKKKLFRTRIQNNSIIIKETKSTLHIRTKRDFLFLKYYNMQQK